MIIDALVPIYFGDYNNPIFWKCYACDKIGFTESSWNNHLECKIKIER